MADEPTKQPTEPTGQTKAEPAPIDAAPTMPADPLSDGTVPTVLAPGSTHRTVPKGRASITSIYRRADVMTTLFTLGGVLLAGALVVGGYYFVTQRNKTTTTTTAPKVTTLSKDDLQKLGAFFTGNSAGSGSEVLTISSSSLFNNRVAIGSDLKVVGGASISGSTTLTDLTVDKTSTLGITSVRGSLTVAGPLSVQSPATLSGGATVNGNLTVSGNGSFGGAVAAGVINTRDLTVSGTLNINGHLSIGGQNPSAAPVMTASATVSGNDSAGTVTTGAITASGTATSAELVWVTFRNAFPRVPTVIITPIGRCSAAIQPYIQVTATKFLIGAAHIDSTCTSSGYSFSYWVVQ